MPDSSAHRDGEDQRFKSRRKALMRLGLAAGAVYVTPTIIKLQTVNAQSFPGLTSCPPLPNPRPSTCPS